MSFRDGLYPSQRQPGSCLLPVSAHQCGVEREERVKGWGARGWTHGSPEGLVHLYKKGVKVIGKEGYVTFSTKKLRLSNMVREKSRIFSAFLGLRERFFKILLAPQQ